MNDYHRISEGILGAETVEKTNTELFLSLVSQYFPEAIKDGEVDFTALKEEMGEFPQVSSEHYEFTWAGKQAAKKEAQADLFGRTLKYKPQDSLNPDTTENIYIEGDNLEALKLLRRNYHGKIKMIYIDPPYNTGNDFVYRDNFTMTEEDLAELSGDIEDGFRLQKNPKDNAKYHTKWLNMMYPRLKIARDLLADDGVVFISIDDNEQENLKKICDDIFGNNFIGQIVWQSTQKNDPKFIAINHEYILCYCKNIQHLSTIGKWRIKHPLVNDMINEYQKIKQSCDDIDEILEKWNKIIKLDKYKPLKHYKYVDFRGPYFAADISDPQKNGPKHDFVIHPVTKKLCKAPAGGYSPREEEMRRRLENNEIHFGPTHEYVVCSKKYLVTAEDRLNSVYYEDGRRTSKMVDKLLGSDVFKHPKSEILIKRLIEFTTNKDSYILDFFSGSATTAHSVMLQNAEDKGKRKFILVQYPELTYYYDKNSIIQPKADSKAAFNAGYKNICEIGKERIRRAAKKIHEDNPEAKFDDGFKVLEVADTNIRWNTIDDKRIKLLTDYDYLKDDKDDIDFTPGHNDIDIVYEIMLRQFDIPLSTPIEKLSSVSDRTYIFADAVAVCLEPDIDEQLIERLAAIEPTPAKFVLRDSAFNDDIELKDVSFRRLSALIANHQTEKERKSKYNNYTVEFI